MKNKKILVATSGGVDSAAAIRLLQYKKYEVVACILRMHHLSQESINDCKKICDKLGVSLIIEDVTTKFTKIVKANFFNEYFNGRTPNPCVLCNYEVKFKALQQIAKKNNIAQIATGHYARVGYNVKTERYILYTAKSVNKDQTYMLWRLNQDVLSMLVLPIGEFTSKDEIRAFAKKEDMPLFDKHDSQDICFISDNNYRSFMNEYANENNLSLSKQIGYIVLDDKIIGKHSGYIDYTIGQRRGLGVSYKQPLYVKAINSKDNIVEVSTADNTYCKGLIANNINIIKYNELEGEKEFIVKIRYKDTGQPAKCKINGTQLFVKFNEPRQSPTPGQSVVMYDADELVGGGIIESAV